MENSKMIMIGVTSLGNPMFMENGRIYYVYDKKYNNLYRLKNQDEAKLWINETGMLRADFHWSR